MPAKGMLDDGGEVRVLWAKPEDDPGFSGVGHERRRVAGAPLHFAWAQLAARDSRHGPHHFAHRVPLASTEVESEPYGSFPQFGQREDMRLSEIGHVDVVA